MPGTIIQPALRDRSQNSRLLRLTEVEMKFRHMSWNVRLFHTGVRIRSASVCKHFKWAYRCLQTWKKLLEPGSICVDGYWPVCLRTLAVLIRTPVLCESVSVPKLMKIEPILKHGMAPILKLCEVWGYLLVHAYLFINIGYAIPPGTRQFPNRLTGLPLEA